jgi:hypothetical protein
LLCAIMREGLDLAGEFAKMVRKRRQESLAQLLEKAEVSACRELRRFAVGLRPAQAAVALYEAWRITAPTALHAEGTSFAYTFDDSRSRHSLVWLFLDARLSGGFHSQEAGGVEAAGAGDAGAAVPPFFRPPRPACWTIAASS